MVRSGDRRKQNSQPDERGHLKKIGDHGPKDSHIEKHGAHAALLAGQMDAQRREITEHGTGNQRAARCLARAVRD